MPFSCLFIKSFLTKFTLKHIWFLTFFYLFHLFYLFFAYFCSSHLSHCKSQTHRLFFPIRNYVFLDFLFKLFFIWVIEILLFLKIFNCYFEANLCLAELNSFLLLIKIFLHIIWCLWRDSFTKDLPHSLQGNSVGSTSRIPSSGILFEISFVTFDFDLIGI